MVHNNNRAKIICQAISKIKVSANLRQPIFTKRASLYLCCSDINDIRYGKSRYDIISAVLCALTMAAYICVSNWGGVMGVDNIDKFHCNGLLDILTTLCFA
jgi:hypothetical protein